MTAATAAIDTPTAPPGFAQTFVRYAFWPLFVVGMFVSMIWADQSGQHSSLRAGASMLTLFGVMLLEQLLPRYVEGGVRGDPQLRYDIGYLVGNGLVEALCAGAMLLPALWLAPQLTAWLGTAAWPSEWPWAIQVVLAFLAVDFLDYWVHRASHRVPWLWSLHVYHHDTERLHVFKGVRNHPLSPLVRVVCAYVPLVLLGAPPILLFWFQAYIVSVGSLAHANLDMRFPSWLHRVLVTPPVHRIHHARSHALHDRNFAVFTTLWDRLFRTFEPPQAGVDPRFGLEEGGLEGGFLRQLAWPLSRLRSS